MKNWKAVTESGAVYEYDGGIVRIKSSGSLWDTVFKVWIMRVAIVDEGVEPLNKPWVAPDQWVDGTEPVIGRRLYVSGKDEWRISTPIVSVEELPEEETR